MLRIVQVILGKSICNHNEWAELKLFRFGQPTKHGCQFDIKVYEWVYGCVTIGAVSEQPTFSQLKMDCPRCNSIALQIQARLHARLFRSAY